MISNSLLWIHTLACVCTDQLIPCAANTVCSSYRVQLLPSAVYTVCSSYRLQFIPCAVHTVSSSYRQQLIPCATVRTSSCRVQLHGPTHTVYSCTDQLKPCAAARTNSYSIQLHGPAHEHYSNHTKHICRQFAEFQYNKENKKYTKKIVYYQMGHPWLAS